MSMAVSWRPPNPQHAPMITHSPLLGQILTQHLNRIRHHTILIPTLPLATRHLRQLLPSEELAQVIKCQGDALKGTEGMLCDHELLKVDLGTTGTLLFDKGGSVVEGDGFVEDGVVN